NRAPRHRLTSATSNACRDRLLLSLLVPPARKHIQSMAPAARSFLSQRRQTLREKCMVIDYCWPGAGIEVRVTIAGVVRSLDRFTGILNSGRGGWQRARRLWPVFFDRGLRGGRGWLCRVD